MKICVHHLPSLEAFFEFYQYYYFKGDSKSEILKVDDFTTGFLNEFIAISEGLELDRYGVVTVDYQKTLERFKQDMNIQLNTDHFARLEQKGVFAKRQTRQDGTVVLQFDVREFKMTQKIWRILKEIEKWNEKGFVDMSEEEAKATKKSDGCSQCSAELIANAKFCSECGYKIAA